MKQAHHRAQLLSHACDAISVLFIMYEPQSFMDDPSPRKARSLTAYYPRTNNEHSNDQAFMREPPRYSNVLRWTISNEWCDDAANAEIVEIIVSA